MAMSHHVLTAVSASLCVQCVDCMLTAASGCLQRGKQFAETSTRARQTIAELGAGFVHQDAVVMVHGYSRVALALLQQVASNVRTAYPPVAAVLIQLLVSMLVLAFVLVSVLVLVVMLLLQELALLLLLSRACNYAVST